MQTTRASRRTFLQTTGAAVVGLGAGWRPASAAAQPAPLYKISLAQWSINQPLRKGTLQHLDFAKIAKSVGIDAIEYVNQFFMDKATDAAYLREMNTRAQGEGVTQVLIMCDNEGRLGDPDEAARRTAVENHHKWVTAAKTLGCHAIRVNAYSEGSYDEQMARVADGLHALCRFAEQHDIDVIIENHGGLSSNAAWLMATIRQADHPRAGTLPDFGNFRISGPNRENPNRPVESYDSYQGVREMMPLARGVSVKPTVWDAKGHSHPIDLDRMMRIVVEAGYRGYCGIEHGKAGAELEAIRELREQLDATRQRLASARG